MALAFWPTFNRPQGVPREIQDFDHSLWSIPYDAVRCRPGQVYTIFNDDVRTFA